MKLHFWWLFFSRSWTKVYWWTFPGWWRKCGSRFLHEVPPSGTDGCIKFLIFSGDLSLGNQKPDWLAKLGASLLEVFVAELPPWAKCCALIHVGSSFVFKCCWSSLSPRISTALCGCILVSWFSFLKDCFIQCFKWLKAVLRCFSQLRRSVSLEAKQGVSLNFNNKKSKKILKIRKILIKSHEN